MTEWMKLQGRSARVLNYVVSLTLFVGGVALAMFVSDPACVPVGEGLDVCTMQDRRGGAAAALGFGGFLAAALGGVVSVSARLVRIDDDGLTVVGLPWRRVSWGDVQFITRHPGVYLNYVVVITSDSRRTRGGEYWLTRQAAWDFRTPDLDYEFSVLTERWERWKKHHASGQTKADVARD